MGDKADSRAMPERWPRALLVQPMAPFLGAVAVLVAVWAGVVAVDVLNVGRAAGGLGLPFWAGMFNFSVVEVVQWIYLALTAVGAGYVGGRLAGGPYSRAGSLFTFFGLGLGLMLIEDAGDVRYMLGSVGERVFGPTILGLPHPTFTHFPVYALLAFFPLYALIRYGRDVWQAPSVRKYLVAAFLLYGISQLMSLTSRVGYFYQDLGHAINNWLFVGRLPLDVGIATAYYFVDSAVEESMELLAIGCLLSMLLAFVRDLRSGMIGDPDLPAQDRPCAAAEPADRRMAPHDDRQGIR